MISLISTIIALGASGALFYMLVYKPQTLLIASTASSQETLQAEVQQAEGSLKELIADNSEYASVTQLEYVTNYTSTVEDAIAEEKEKLDGIEIQLEDTQTEVELREIKIQDLKGTKDEEAKLLTETSKEFDALNEETEKLESSLSNSLEELGRIEDEAELSKEQKRQFDEFTSTLSDAQDRLRELGLESDETSRRLKVLSQQYKNLEEEYTKLVEQQFA